MITELQLFMQRECLQPMHALMPCQAELCNMQLHRSVLTIGIVHTCPVQLVFTARHGSPCFAHTLQTASASAQLRWFFCDGGGDAPAPAAPALVATAAVAAGLHPAAAGVVQCWALAAVLVAAAAAGHLQLCCQHSPLLLLPLCLTRHCCCCCGLCCR